MKPRLYFDTSVFGGVYDDEFEEISSLQQNFLLFIFLPQGLNV